MKETVPESRVSMLAAKELADYLRHECEQLTKRAWVFAKHGKRETITIEDVKLAIEEGTKT
jgi:histone H3/H4